jgi:hypothetical protein
MAQQRPTARRMRRHEFDEELLDGNFMDAAILAL